VIVTVTVIHANSRQILRIFFCNFDTATVFRLGVRSSLLNQCSTCPGVLASSDLVAVVLAAAMSCVLMPPGRSKVARELPGEGWEGADAEPEQGA